MLFYRILYLPGLLIGLPYYLFRMWRRGGYRKGFGNRFGVMGKVPPKRGDRKRIWIQAVSVGELVAIEPMLKRLADDDSVEVFLTTTTSTGYRVLEGRLAPLTSWHGVFPLDFWLFSRRAWKRLQPDLAILMEGELWPEHIYQASRRNVPVILVNARLSDRSFKRHLSFKGLTRHYYHRLEGILAGSQTDQDRFTQLGWLPPERIVSTGNLKLDVLQEAPPEREERAALLAELGFPPEGTTVLLGSSTWSGEESALIESFINLRSTFPDLRLLIVPRHAERIKELESLVSKYPVQSHFRSKAKQAPAGTEVYIADTTGELHMLTRFADLVFVGKSLPPNEGGQTPVESAALGKPMLFGPNMSNFRDIARNLTQAGAVQRVESPEALQASIHELLLDPGKREDMAKAAYAFIEANRGATDRIIGHIKSRTLS
ncbi:MAG: 3-deoxy-D-manno-octulosonic acid transferase [Puniceicoccaceae bacterium]